MEISALAMVDSGVLMFLLFSCQVLSFTGGLRFQVNGKDSIQCKLLEMNLIEPAGRQLQHLWKQIQEVKGKNS